ncbi:Gamma-glutamylputrescine oxidoreductase [Hyphodiscus hymeniophilus]|uniref:Gamma-glutamylputrescine oxidoreductase n=1 Tax=Hyphodiscus hymeniophilus TaxID=353542 RepID=A0A9P6VF93_9HELO|nr:Gamma-glutamylputrescine oxidoreductase [Hyphodiscus hymeniophilus]
MPSPTPPMPIQNSTESFWRTQLDPLDSHRTTEALPTKTDIVVIGAGYAGVSAVYFLLERSKVLASKPSIVILEAREACSGATGRNGGHLKPDLHNRPASIASEFGIDAAAEAAAFEAEHVGMIKEVVEKEKIDCDFVVTRVVDVPLNESVGIKLKAGYEQLVKSAAAPFKDVSYTDYDKAEGMSGVKGAKGCFTYTAGHLWPYKFVLHLLTKAITEGVNLQTHTPVQRVSSSQDAEGYWAITTARGAIRAKTIVHASNAYTSTILPEYKDSIVPVRGICCRITTPKPAPHLSNSYILRSSGWDYEYLIPRSDGSIVVGGARSVFYSDLSNWYNTTDDSKLMDSARHYFDGYMQRHFRGWEDSGAAVDKIWTGIMGYSTDSLPHIGAVPSKPSQFMLAGFTGHGMPQIFLSARGIASMIMEDKKFEETGVPRIYQTTRARLDSKRNKILESWEESQNEVRSKL